MKRSALLSECGKYRFTLEREWDPDLPCVLWVLLNPSTADAEVDDHTVRKGIGFSKRWGFGSMIFVNLFAWRATSPKDMKAAKEPVGEPMNNVHIFAAVGRAEKVVLAWGTHGSHRDQDKSMLKFLEGCAGDKLYSLGRTKDGHPKHPLTLAYDTPLEKWS